MRQPTSESAGLPAFRRAKCRYAPPPTAFPRIRPLLSPVQGAGVGRLGAGHLRLRRPAGRRGFHAAGAWRPRQGPAREGHAVCLEAGRFGRSTPCWSGVPACVVLALAPCRLLRPLPAPALLPGAASVLTRTPSTGRPPPHPQCPAQACGSSAMTQMVAAGAVSGFGCALSSCRGEGVLAHSLWWCRCSSSTLPTLQLRQPGAAPPTGQPFPPPHLRLQATIGYLSPVSCDNFFQVSRVAGCRRPGMPISGVYGAVATLPSPHESARLPARL